MRVPLLDKIEGARFMDIPYLAKGVVIVGELEGRYGYSFKYGSTLCIILLPNEQYINFSRYYSRPTAAPRQPGPLQDMYVEMRKMTRWNKFQGRVIRKLFNEGAQEVSSSQAAPPPRQRSQRHYIHSPPCPESDNESPSFSTDEDFDSSRYYY
ncbi:unnamed protein product [Cochlearia groenlandica]